MTKSYKTLVFDAKIRNEIISISLKVPISYGEYAITNMYRPKDLFQAPFPFATLEDGESLQEFQQDCANIIEVTNSIENMDVLRIETLEAISSISAVSEETAASSGSVYNIAQEQKEVVIALQEASEDLKVKMENLKNAVSIFITET